MNEPWEGMGYEDTKLLTYGLAVGLKRSFFGGGMTVVGEPDPAGYREHYYYDSMEVAREAFLAWDGVGEPQDWITHSPEGVRGLRTGNIDSLKSGGVRGKVLNYRIEEGVRHYESPRSYYELVSEPLPNSDGRLRVKLADRGMRVGVEGEGWLFVGRETLEAMLNEVKRVNEWDKEA